MIPFRDRGQDELRPANLACVRSYVESLDLGPVIVVEDGSTGSFNRSRAYNIGAAQTDADVLVFYESDLIVPREQLVEAIARAAEAPGLVVPFSRFMAITPEDSVKVRGGDLAAAAASAVQQRGEYRSIGAVNVVSRESLDSVGGYDEAFSGAWHDDDAMEIAFRICCGPTRFIDGPAYHLHHLPGTSGEHLTAEDKAATARNKARWKLYRQARTPEQIRALTQ